MGTISYFPWQWEGASYPARATVVIAKYAIDHAKDFFTRLDKELADSGEAPC